MEEEKKDFINALTSIVKYAISEEVDVIYSNRCVQIIDARNHIIRWVDETVTDESRDIYSLRDLSCLDDDLNTVPNMMRIIRIAETYWK